MRLRGRPRPDPTLRSSVENLGGVDTRGCYACRSPCGVKPHCEGWRPQGLQQQGPNPCLQACGNLGPYLESPWHALERGLTP